MRLLTPVLIALGLAFSAPVIAQGTPAAATATAPNATVAATPAVAAPAELKPVDGLGQPVPAGLGLQEQVTPIGRQALWMHDVILMPVITAISVFVLGLLIWVAFRYRRSANPVPSKTSHNTTIEVIWTLVPVLILVGIAIPSIGLLAAQYKPVGKNAVTIKAIGNQWYWTYEYPDHGGFEIVSNMLSDEAAKAKGEPRLLGVDNRMVVPVGVPIRVLTTSMDVIHSWAMPALWTKMDAVPGRINETTFTIDKAGVYYGQCTELCGARHGFMPIAVEAVSPSQFAQWIAAKGGKMPGSKPLAVSTDGGQPVGMGVKPKVGDGTGKPQPSASPLATSNALAPATK